MTNKPLRFAPVIRVSTEQQENKKSSLENQKNIIVKAVESLGGTIPDECWHYSGQEHSTPRYERKLLDALLRDSSKGTFDAVIVVDPSRWSRDNRRSKEGLDTLRTNGIKFFTGTMEMNLFDPISCLFLGMSTEINEFTAAIQSKKSIESRILNAKKGIPSSGKLPYGRTFDRKANTWGIDIEKQKKIVWAAEQYLNGQGLSKIAATLGMNMQNLWNTLRERCGDTWKITFHKPDLNINEIITIEIPPLLPPETIRAIHERLEANQTYYHGQIKNKYLLGRMVFCGDCGCALVGYKPPMKNHQAYRHQKHQDIKRKCPQYTRWQVRADRLEEAVLAHVFNIMGNQDLLEEAMRKAVPSYEKTEKIRDQIAGFERDLSKVKRGIERLTDIVCEGAMPKEMVKAKADDLGSREKYLETEIERLKQQIKNTPTIKEIQEKGRMARRVFETLWKQYCSSYKAFQKMTFEDKRAMLQRFFAGKDEDGNRLGVYVTKRDKRISYSIKGILPIQPHGDLPIDDEMMKDLLRVPADYDPEQAGDAITNNTKFSYYLPNTALL